MHDVSARLNRAREIPVLASLSAMKGKNAPLAGITGSTRTIKVSADRLNLGLVLGNKVMVCNPSGCDAVAGRIMQTKRIPKTPGPDHPITIEPALGRVVVRVGGLTIADTQNALTLRESDYDPVYYIPLSDVDSSLLERTNHSTYCPYKGDASYYSIVAGETRSENAVWTYEAPYEAVDKIKGHVSFYPNRVDALESP